MGLRCFPWPRFNVTRLVAFGRRVLRVESLAGRILHDAGLSSVGARILRSDRPVIQSGRGLQQSTTLSRFSTNIPLLTWENSENRLVLLGDYVSWDG